MKKISMTKTEKELQTIEDNLKKEAETLENKAKELEGKSKSLEANKEQFAKEQDEKEKNFKAEVEKAHDEFEKFITKEQSKLGSPGPGRGGFPAPKSVFKAHGNLVKKQEQNTSK